MVRVCIRPELLQKALVLFVFAKMQHPDKESYGLISRGFKMIRLQVSFSSKSSTLLHLKDISNRYDLPRNLHRSLQASRVIPGRIFQRSLLRWFTQSLDYPSQRSGRWKSTAKSDLVSPFISSESYSCVIAQLGCLSRRC